MNPAHFTFPVPPGWTQTNLPDRVAISNGTVTVEFRCHGSASNRLGHLCAVKKPGYHRRWTTANALQGLANNGAWFA